MKVVFADTFYWIALTSTEDEAHADYGDCYTFTAIDPVTKLMPCWLVGIRDQKCTEDFMLDLATRIPGRIQLTTDGFNAYPVSTRVNSPKNDDAACVAMAR